MILSRKCWLFTVLICLLAGILPGCSDNNSSKSNIVSKSIGASGGSIDNIAVTGGTMTVDIPAGALAVNTVITVTPLEAAALPGQIQSNTLLAAVKFTPEGTVFAVGKPMVATFPLAAAKTAGTKLTVLLWNSVTSAWDINTEATVSADGMKAVANILHFSTYALVENAVVKTIGSAGGSIQSVAVNGGTLKVDVPAGALAADTAITATPIEIAILPAPVAASKVLVSVVLGPTGTTFAAGKPAVITFPLATAKTAGVKMPVLLWNTITSSWSFEAEAVVGADGKTAAVNLEHFSTYSLVDASGILYNTTKYLLGSGKSYTGVPTPFTPDIIFNGNIATESASILFNCPIQKSASGYNSITQAPSATYTSNQTFAVGSQTMPLAVGDVFIGNAKDYTGYPINPPTTFYFKLRIVAISYHNLEAMLIFEYDRIKNPLNVNPG